MSLRRSINLQKSAYRCLPVPLAHARGSVRVSGIGRQHKTGESGSALLIVFVFAAMIAIMLYKEMPVAAFEAQRQKEQLLIDRGNEYSHAVKLFVRKLGTYPASMEALEKTNQMRFLRHRFKDPFTGKEDWRVLHAGPNGMLTDSKVKTAGLVPNGNGNGNNGVGGQSGSAGGNAPFGSSSNTNGNAAQGGNSGFGNNGFGSNGSGSDSSSTAADVVVPPIAQRAPAVAANGSGSPATAGVDQNPSAPLLPPAQADNNPAGQSGANGPNGSNGGPGSTTGMSGQNGASNGLNAFGGNGSTIPMANGLGQQGPSNNPGTGMGTMTSGGLAGVASIAKGHSIKVVNDQTDYSLWEFYYDPTKDATKGIASAMTSMGAAGQQPNGQQTGLGQNQQQQSGFGSSSPFGTNGSSGTSGFGISGFSSNGSNGNTVTPSTGTSPQQLPPPQ